MDEEKQPVLVTGPLTVLVVGNEVKGIFNSNQQILKAFLAIASNRDAVSLCKILEKGPLTLNSVGEWNELVSEENQFASGEFELNQLKNPFSATSLKAKATK